jgi:hypothetical protein
MILTIAPILGASLIAASLTVDEFHNWVSNFCSYGTEAKAHVYSMIVLVVL